MKKLLSIVVLCTTGAVSAAPTNVSPVNASVQDVDNISQTKIKNWGGQGSGLPSTPRSPTNAMLLDAYSNSFHAPGYMPGYPTAATIWARTVEVPCVAGKDGSVLCEPFGWQPGMGRGEYLNFRPVITSPEPRVVERVIIQEVQPKSIKQ